MYVVATAGHVDHGKSTLVRALTGMEPDRFAEEKRRGLTIDLGYAWTRLAPPDGPVLAFVDVPGHERFLANMLAGLGPAPAVLFVVAADEGWREQSADHLAAVNALGVRHGLLVITRSDLADPSAATAQARAEIATSSLGDVPAVAVSAVTGAGLDELRRALAGLTEALPPPRTDGRIRLWIDRSFVIRGAGTVVTGTLAAGTLRVGQQLVLGDRPVTVRGLQTLGTDEQTVSAVARVAVNLRGVPADEVGRGDALCSPDGWPQVDVVDVACGRAAEELPAQLVAHVGTAAVPARVRPLDADLARLSLDHPLPLQPGDRLVLRDPGRHEIAAGASVLDVDPAPLQRRGAAHRRAVDLSRLQGAPSAARLAEQVRRRRAVRRQDLITAGVDVTEPEQVRTFGDWFVDPQVWAEWRDGVRRACAEQAAATPLDPRLSIDAACRQLQVPDRSLLVAAAAEAGLVVAGGYVRSAAAPDLGAAEAGVRQVEQLLRAQPFRAPERGELQSWGLGPRELAAAEQLGRVVRLSPEVVLLPTGPALAMRALAALPQPFTTSQAREALATTRRVVIPLLEHLDHRGWTRRVDRDHRTVRTG